MSFENNIEWFFRPSIQCSKNLEILRNKLPKLLDRHPNGVTLFVCLGTYDLTEKDKEGFISLRSRTNSFVYKINSVFKQFYFFQRLPTIVAEYVRSCHECQIRTTSSFHTKVGIVSFPTLSEPFQVWEMDLCGPFPLSSAGHSYIFYCN